MLSKGAAKNSVLGKCGFLGCQKEVQKESMASVRVLARVEHIPVSWLVSGPEYEHPLVKGKFIRRSVCDVPVAHTLQIQNTSSVIVFL